MKNTPNRFENPTGRLINMAFDIRLFRKAGLKIFEKKLKKLLMNEPAIPIVVRRQRVDMGRAIIRAVSRFLDSIQNKKLIKQSLKKRVAPALMKTASKQSAAQVRFEEQFGEQPPGFLVISPTRTCMMISFLNYISTSRALCISGFSITCPSGERRLSIRCLSRNRDSGCSGKCRRQ